VLLFLVTADANQKSIVRAIGTLVLSRFQSTNDEVLKDVTGEHLKAH
jgi:hypothetical protein